MQLFYNPDITNESDSFSFDKEESRHIVKVLRKMSGDKLFVTNGNGWLFTTEIVLASDNKCVVKIVESELKRHRPFRLHLAVAPTKMNERYEWFLEKATEIGVDEITPIICDHSERKVIKGDRMEKIVQSAMKQSLQFHIPKFHEAISYAEFVKNNDAVIKLIAHCEESDRKSIKDMVSPGSDVTIMIGPEGDFSNKEIQLAFDNGFKPVILGDTRLRTETAAIVACHSVNFINQS